MLFVLDVLLCVEELYILILFGGSVGDSFCIDFVLVVWICEVVLLVWCVCLVCIGVFYFVEVGVLDGLWVIMYWDLVDDL